MLISHESQRCGASAECPESEQCVTPYTPSTAGQIVRMYTRTPSWISHGQEVDKVFVFEGELVDIWESGECKDIKVRRE